MIPERSGSQFYGGPQDGMCQMATFGLGDYIKFVVDDSRHALYVADELGAMRFVGYVPRSQEGRSENAKVGDVAYQVVQGKPLGPKVTVEEIVHFDDHDVARIAWFHQGEPDLSWVLHRCSVPLFTLIPVQA